MWPPILGEEMSASTTDQPAARPNVSGDQALSVTHLDSERAYGDVSRFRVQVSLEPDGWHVEYQVKNPLTKGGAPHYVIDASSGQIISKRYYQ